MSDEYLTTEELAARFKVPAQLLRQWRMVKGKGPPYAKIGRHVRYPVASLVEWEAAQVKG